MIYLSWKFNGFTVSFRSSLAGSVCPRLRKKEIRRAMTRRPGCLSHDGATTDRDKWIAHSPEETQPWERTGCDPDGFRCPDGVTTALLMIRVRLRRRQRNWGRGEALHKYHFSLQCRREKLEMPESLLHSSSRIRCSKRRLGQLTHWRQSNKASWRLTTGPQRDSANRRASQFR